MSKYNEYTFRVYLLDEKKLIGSGPLVVLQILLNLARKLREPLQKIVNSGGLGDADVLELIKLASQLLEIHFRGFHNVSHHRQLNQRKDF
jgi:hypothetical protein